MSLNFTSHAKAVAALQQRASQVLSGRHGVRALEAGAGKRTRLDLPEDAYIVGVDADASAMSHNERLNEQVLSDLAQYRPGQASFDVITCWYVLEHVDDPPAVLAAFAHWVAPGGLVVLAVPSLRSPKAWFTKLAPHSFLVWFRRRVLGFPNAGKPGYGPYPTTLRWSIRPSALRRWASRAGLEIVFEGYSEDDKQVTVRQLLHLRGRLWTVVCALTRIVSLGQLDAERTELLLMLRRPATTAAV
jgi:SAM-dependent methyltransferase